MVDKKGGPALRAPKLGMDGAVKKDTSPLPTNERPPPPKPQTAPTDSKKK